MNCIRLELKDLCVGSPGEEITHHSVTQLLLCDVVE
jgi:hypothetical protein